MNNRTAATVIASINFDFRGERFTPSITVDLHGMMIKKQPLNYLYVPLSASIGLDDYRYEYDVMILEEIVFSDPTGLATDFVADGILDFDGFSEAWQEQQTISEVQPIAERHLNISDLNEHKALQQALVAAYKTGQKNPLLTKKESLASAAKPF